MVSPSDDFRNNFIEYNFSMCDNAIKLINQYVKEIR